MDKIGVKKQFKTLAKMGYIARGVIYIVVGALAVMTLFSGEGKTTDSKGAIATIMEQPFGNFLIVILIIGLIGYVVWRFTQAVKDTDDHGTDMKGLVIRGALLVSAVTHSLLAIWAAKLLLGEQSQGGSSNTEGLIATTPGQIALGIAGIAAVGAGIAHIFKGWTARFERYMNIPSDTHKFARPICQFGLIARGVVWCIVGWFFLRSAFWARSEEVKGMAEALQTLLQDNAFGPWLMGIVALGLVAFGIYSFLEAMYRRINVSQSA